MVDLVMTFNVAIISAQNKLILDRKVIAITYLKSWFLLDLAASVPFDLIIQAASSEDDLSMGGEGSNTASATSLLKGFKVRTWPKCHAIRSYGLAGFATLEEMERLTHTPLPSLRLEPARRRSSPAYSDFLRS